MTSDGVNRITGYAEPDLERQLLDDISIDDAWRTVERLGSLVRTSGSPEERQAVDYLTEQLDAAGVPYQLHRPECFISVPQGATLRIDEPGGKSFPAKTVAMSWSTGGREISGELAYVPTSGERGASFFGARIDLNALDVKGKVVLTEGMAGPGHVRDLMEAGALAGIFVNPGERIHEGICTTIWGAPDLDSAARQPTIPAINVNHASGRELIEVAERGGSVALSTTLDVGWRPIPVLVAEITGAQVPEEFVLLHGHLDGWHFGVADNATGDATLLELARVCYRHRDRLARSLRLAWWSGHSHGRYAGSTWYADTFAIDLARNCVAQINCDSPGARWAETYNRLTCMSEAAPLVERVIKETTGITPQPSRPGRAGDYSFNSIGVSSFYMLSSTMSDEKRREMNYYGVGGCGGNIAWHTEDDTMEIADRDNLLRDLRMYAASTLRVLNAPIHPFDWRGAVAEFRRTIDRYQEAAGDQFDFSPSRETLDELDRSLSRFYASAPAGGSSADPKARRYNFAQRRLARLLVRANFSRMPEFWHDPAVNVAPLPDLAPAMTMSEARNDAHARGTLRAHLTRGQNRLVWSLEQAREVVDIATQA